MSLTFGMLGALTAVALASGSASIPAHSATPPNSGKSPRSDLERMAADHLSQAFGLSKPEAMNRVREQEGHSRTALTIAEKLGDRSPGSFIDQKRGKLVVNVSDDEAATLVGGEKVEARVVGTTASQLAQIRQQAEQRLGSMMRSSAVDTTRNMIVLSVPAKDLAAAGQATSDLSKVEIQESPDDAVPLSHPVSAMDKKAHIGGGDRIDYKLANGNVYSCSYGFSVTKGNEEGFVTAGHCAEKGRKFTKESKSLGEIKEFSFPGEDMAYASLDMTQWIGDASVNKMSGGEMAPVKGSTEAAVGAAVCKSGLSTKWTCGTITAKNATSVNSPNDPKTRHEIKGLTETDVCALRGDSGGPWMAGDQAQGVTSSGNATSFKDGKCQNSRGDKIKTHFQPINPILKKYGLTLKVSK
ncbi:streptogrisin C [Austwickia chelonae]|uniref:Putative peptidase n=2 Tax=Austwickia TaxID=1184606 RepID=K6ULM6_9MICO|nr:putative peptidase [Austwickia chelonae NBRC 105200]SEW09148.1 streptogrisin C [Austwickia chelonae]